MLRQLESAPQSLRILGNSSAGEETLRGTRSSFQLCCRWCLCNRSANETRCQYVHMLVRHFFVGFVILTALTAQSGNHKLPGDDAVRIHEFYRLASEIQD